MTGFGILLGLLIVMLAAKPSFQRANRCLRDARNEILELRRRRHLLSQKIRQLGRESLGQRLTAGQDAQEAEDITMTLAGLERRLAGLEALDRRVLVFDERRGISESGWILLIRRPPDAAPPGEPEAVTQRWDEGRFIFVFAHDPARARRKANVRFPPDAGFVVLDTYAHEGDLSELPMVGGEGQSARRATG